MNKWFVSAQVCWFKWFRVKLKNKAYVLYLYIQIFINELGSGSMFVYMIDL